MLQAPASQQRHGNFTKWAALTVALLALISSVAAQTAVTIQPENPFAQDMAKYPGLLTEFGQLLEKLRHGVQLPPQRGESRLLPLLSESTVLYAAFPNYGDASHQTLTIF